MRTKPSQRHDEQSIAAIDAAFSDPPLMQDILNPVEQSPSSAVHTTQSGILQRLSGIFPAQRSAKRKSNRRSLRGMESLSPRVAMDASGIFTDDLTGIDAAEWGEVAPGTPAGALESMIPHPTSVMNDLAITSDGKTMATSARDGKIHLYNAQSGALQRILTGHTGNVVQVDFSPDGTQIASASYDRSVRIWDVASGTLTSQINLPQLGTRVKFSPDGKHIAIGVHEMPTQVVDLQTGAIENIEYPRSTEAARFDFTADSSGLAHSYNNTIALYDLNAHQYIRTYEGLSDQIYSVDIDPSGKYLAGGDSDGGTALWNIQTGELLAQQKDHTGRSSGVPGVWAIQFDARSAHLISADHSGRVIVRDVSGLEAGDIPVELARYQGPRQPGSIVATPAGHVFAMNTAYDQASGKVIIYDLPDPPTTCEPAPATTQDAENSALALELADILSQPEEKEAPIKPDLSVIKIEGLNIVASVSSPHNKSVVSVGPRGVLSRQNLSHEGGTAFELAYVTFDRSLMSGDYVLFLTDAETGKTLDGIGVRWNMRSGVLSLIDPGNDLIKADTAVDTSAFDSLMNINSAYLGDEQINWIMSARLYQLTNDLPPGYDFDISGAELEEKIYAIRPEYHPDNRYAEIMRRWREQYPTFQSGDVERWYDWERIEFFNRMKEGLAYYEKAMTEMMQIAVDGFIQIRKGMNENQMEYNLNLAFDRWINPINNAYKVQASKLAELQNIGIHLPSRARIIESARLVLDKAWQEIIQRAGDVENFKESLKHIQQLTNNGWGQNEEGKWVIVDPKVYLASLMRDEGVHTLTALLENLRGDGTPESALASILSAPFTSPAVASSMMNGLLAYESGQRYGRSADGEIVNITLLSANLTDIEGIGEPFGTRINNIFDGYIPQAVLHELSGFSQQEVFNQVQHWYYSASSLKEKLYMKRDFAIRTDTIVGQIMMGAAEKLFSSPPEEWWGIAARLQIVTDIPAQMFIDIRNNNSVSSSFGTAMQDLMVKAQYSHLTEVRNISETPYAVSAKPDREASLGASYETFAPVRIRFDAVTHGKAIIGVEAWFEGRVVAQSEGATFIDVPVESFNKSADGLIVTLRIKLVNDKILETESETFNIRLNFTAFIPQTNYSLSVSNNPIENAILNSLEFPLEAEGWVHISGSPHHHGKNLHALDLSKASDTGSMVKMAATGYIDHVNIDDGRIIVRHETSDGHQWFTQYEHMTHILESITNVKYISLKDEIDLNLTPEQSIKAAQDRNVAKAAIDAYINRAKAEQTPLLQNSELGALGNEGKFTSGSHLHFSVYDESGNSINISHWADLKQPGIRVLADVGNKPELYFTWNKELNALFNAVENIAMVRVNVIDGQKIIGSENHAYVIDEERAIRVIWKAVKYNGETLPVERWVKFDDQLEEWNGTSFISH